MIIYMIFESIPFFKLAGVLWDSDRVVELARLATNAQNVEFLGIYTHCSVSYSLSSDKAVRNQAETDTKRILSVCERYCKLKS